MINASPTSRPIFVSRVINASLIHHQGTKAPRKKPESISWCLGVLVVLLILFCDPKLCRSRPGIGGKLGFGGGDGLFREDLQLPSLLRRPKRLLDRAIFHRLETDHRQSSAFFQESRRLLQQGGEVLHFP